MDAQRKMFVAIASLLLGLGLLMVYSASVTARPTAFEEVYLGKQSLFLAIAVTVSIGAGLLPAGMWRRGAPWLFGGTLLLLAVVLIPGVGTSVNGSRRWIRFGGWTMQPSELAKISIPLMICHVAHLLREQRAGAWRVLMMPALPAVVAIALILPEPDLGDIGPSLAW